MRCYDPLCFVFKMYLLLCFCFNSNLRRWRKHGGDFFRGQLKYCLMVLSYKHLGFLIGQEIFQVILHSYLWGRSTHFGLKFLCLNFLLFSSIVGLKANFLRFKWSWCYVLMIDAFWTDIKSSLLLTKDKM